MTGAETRFRVHVVKCADWEAAFVGWIDVGHERYYDCKFSWDDGMEMYGGVAQVPH